MVTYFYQSDFTRYTAKCSSFETIPHFSKRKDNLWEYASHSFEFLSTIVIISYLQFESISNRSERGVNVIFRGGFNLEAIKSKLSHSKTLRAFIVYYVFILWISAKKFNRSARAKVLLKNTRSLVFVHRLDRRRLLILPNRTRLSIKIKGSLVLVSPLSLTSFIFFSFFYFSLFFFRRRLYVLPPTANRFFLRCDCKKLPNGRYVHWFTRKLTICFSLEEKETRDNIVG